MKLKLGVPSAIFRANWVWSRRFYRPVLLASLFVPSLLYCGSTSEMNRPVDCQDELQASGGFGFLLGLVSLLYFHGFLLGRICGAELSDNLVGLSSNLAVSCSCSTYFSSPLLSDMSPR